MAKVFISHSSENKKLAEILVTFLQQGMGVNREEIFCTSYPDALPSGQAFIPKIKEALKGCEAVIFLITQEYLTSKFCLAEMGAAWGLGKRIYPLLTVNVDALNKTPLLGIQMRYLNNKGDISAIYDEFCDNHVNSKRSTAEFTDRLPAFIGEVNKILNGDFLLEKDGDEYFHTRICEIRRVPENFRCYRIEGHVKDSGAAKSDWLFFHRGAYPDLEKDDKVKFKIDKTEERTFHDIGCARNIYPAELIKL